MFQTLYCVIYPQPYDMNGISLGKQRQTLVIFCFVMYRTVADMIASNPRVSMAHNLKPNVLCQQAMFGSYSARFQFHQNGDRPNTVEPRRWAMSWARVIWFEIAFELMQVIAEWNQNDFWDILWWNYKQRTFLGIFLGPSIISQFPLFFPSLYFVHCGWRFCHFFSLLWWLNIDKTHRKIKKFHLRRQSKSQLCVCSTLI